MLSRLFTPAIVAASLSALVATANAAPARTPQTFDFPIYTNQPPGKQVGGQHSAATTPSLSPADAQLRFEVPPGFEVRLFAAEPEVVNPVAMTWDDRGRLWVLELYEYPEGAPPGAKPRDRIKVLEDTDADGRADRVHVWADGLDLATGLLLGYGGAFVGQAPHLLFLEDTTGDDRADRRTVLLTGFGRQDRHELLNGFAWGPDGHLYLTHGVFTYSTVRSPEATDAPGVDMNAALARFHPRTRRFEVVAEGTSNPWGVDFDAHGNAFVSACVIDHLFHLTPGGLYVRQAGASHFPYAYQLLPSIVDHRHHMAAYAGVQVYQGDQFPREYQGTILMGNIHDNAVHQDLLTPQGSSFRASFLRDLVRANDPWFRPVSIQVGPDGALWIMDWHDKYPCYQNAMADPGGVDREHGRIWRLVWVGDKPGQLVPSRPQVDMNLAQLNPDELIPLLQHPNIWHRRTAQRLLAERRSPTVRPQLQQAFLNPDSLDGRLAALWALHASEQLEDALLSTAATDPHPVIRAWAAPLMGERAIASSEVLARLERLASDPEPQVRLATATAVRQFSSATLTLNTPPREPNVPLGPILSNLVRHSADASDPLLPFMIWMAAEPHVADDPSPALHWLIENGPETMPLSGQLASKALRRMADMNDPTRLDQALHFLASVADRDVTLAAVAIEGLIQGLEGRLRLPSLELEPVLNSLAAKGNDALATRTRQLGTLLGNSAAVRSTLNSLLDRSLPLEERRRAVVSTRSIKNPEARELLLQLVASDQDELLKMEAIRSLSELGGEQTGKRMLDSWTQLSFTARRSLAESLASRPRWANDLLNRIEDSTIAASEIPATVMRSLMTASDPRVRERAGVVIGRYRDSTPDKLQLIEDKKLVALRGTPSLINGRAITERTCLVCHSFHGQGVGVGPDLTGVGRSTLDALLVNIIDPNQVVGIGYENVTVETHEGRIVSGRLIENSINRIRLMTLGGIEEVFDRQELLTFDTSQLSMMPEGLEQMPDDDFRDMIWYLLNPPQDQRPMTPELRQQLIGDLH